jgi:hypothetical protein
MSVTLTLDLQVAKAITGLASVIAKEGEYDQALVKSIGLTREQAKATSEFQTVQKQSHALVMEFKKHEEELERRLGKATIEERNRILKKNVEVDQLISGSQFAKQRTIIASEKLIAATREQMANEQVARDEKYWRYRDGLLRGHARQGEGLNKVLMTTEEYLQRAGLAQEKVTGADKLAALAQAAGLYMVVTRSVGLLEQGFTKLRAEMDQTLQRGDNLLPHRQQLFSASGGDPASFAAGERVSRELTRTTGLSQADTMDAVALARQLPGFTDSDAFAAAKTQAAYGGNLADKLKFASAMKEAYPGQFPGAAGTERITDLSIAAANIGSWTPSDVPRVMPGSLVSGKKLGAKPEELLAAGSVLSKSYPTSPETAGDRLALIVNRLAEKPEFAGLGLIGSLSRLKNMPREQYAEFVGDTSDKRLGEGLSEEEYHKEVGRRIEMAQAINVLTRAFQDLGETTKKLEQVGKQSGTSQGMGSIANAAIPSTITSVINTKGAGEEQEQTLEDEHLDYASRQKASIARTRSALVKAKVPGLARSLAQIASAPGHLVGAGLKLGTPEGGAAVEFQMAQLFATFFGSDARQKVADARQMTPEGRMIDVMDKHMAQQLDVFKSIRDALTGSAGKGNRGAATAQAAHATFGNW